jgi:hypothetical protein
VIDGVGINRLCSANALIPQTTSAATTDHPEPSQARAIRRAWYALSHRARRVEGHTRGDVGNGSATPILKAQDRPGLKRASNSCR